MKEITQDQFYQLFGLCLASVKLEQKREMLADAWTEIVGDENRDSFWDFYDDSDLTEKKLLEKLDYDKIQVKKRGKKNDS